MHPSIQDITLWGGISAACLFAVILIFSILRIPKGFSKSEDSVHHHHDKEILSNVEISMGQTVIRRLDTLDDLISSLLRNEESSDSKVVKQLKVLRGDLLSMLQSHSIESFGFDKGTVLDSSTRKLIKIVESGGDPEKPRRIIETIRPGFRYTSDLELPSTIIRKPEVRIG